MILSKSTGRTENTNGCIAKADWTWRKPRTQASGTSTLRSKWAVARGPLEVTPKPPAPTAKVVRWELRSPCSASRSDPVKSMLVVPYEVSPEAANPLRGADSRA